MKRPASVRFAREHLGCWPTSIGQPGPVIGSKPNSQPPRREATVRATAGTEFIRRRMKPCWTCRARSAIAVPSGGRRIGIPGVYLVSFV